LSFVAESMKYLLGSERWGYEARGVCATEPTALRCLALAARGEREAALAAARWLVGIQTTKGSVGVTAAQEMPAWPTSLAILAWLACDEFDEPLSRAIQWTLNDYGQPAPDSADVGHDTSLRGWSWAANTHSWMEPTCLFVVALKAAGYRDHPRTREAVQLIVDRLLPEGGCNYGSTIVLGQTTLPQVEATGLAMLALADEDVADARIDKSLIYLEQQLGEEISTASLCYGLLGLTAHGRRPSDATRWLEQVWKREKQRGVNCFKTSLMLLADCDNQSWLPDEVL